jgi:methylated-DNA-[protein]-cysteine S-methyltransferase
MTQNSAKWFLRLWGSPVGPLFLAFTPKGLASLDFNDGRARFSSTPGSIPSLDLELPPAQIAAAMNEAIRVIANYFSGIPPDFSSVPLDLQGTPFQLRVWEKLREIPWGVTISYQELAARVGNPKATQAVGRANGANPIPLIVPCHRVIARDGSLGGYSSGLERKRWLLRHEGGW